MIDPANDDALSTTKLEGNEIPNTHHLSSPTIRCGSGPMEAHIEIIVECLFLPRTVSRQPSIFVACSQDSLRVVLNPRGRYTDTQSHTIHCLSDSAKLDRNSSTKSTLIHRIKAMHASRFLDVHEGTTHRGQSRPPLTFLVSSSHSSLAEMNANRFSNCFEMSIAASNLEEDWDLSFVMVSRHPTSLEANEANSESPNHDD
ncbi:hypothetical protein DXG01_014676 [Tephrocybe rancida]|nr:hypothetical protein DXG01_014676 [Tephrocybe rancida]